MIIWKQKPKYTQVELLQYLKKNLYQRADEAFLFGSYAQGKANSESDIDVIIICNTQSPWPERHRAFQDVIQKLGSVDCLIYTPEEWKKMSTEPSPFIQHIQKHWIRIL